MILYIAGKVSNNSQFGTHYWRDGFVDELAKKSGLQLQHLDPLAYEQNQTYNPQAIFDKDCWLISQVDCVIVYLSDDISVGGSQEMLIAKYLGKRLIGLAPKGGKFNKSKKEFLGKTIENYIDPFVYATCDTVCGTIDEVADELRNADSDVKRIDIIDAGIQRMQQQETNL